ncbi:MAG: DUF4399 domain-containing protein [Acetobacteraceae bacterium]|nr:DUF4399 domain-containing protein [Acetobacteraceae bacterium]
MTPAPRVAYLSIISPHDGARIRGGFWCLFGLRNMGVTRAGDDTPNMGHHRLLIDVDEPLDPDQPIPSDKKHLHFGAGETETYLERPPGRRTLQLVLGDAKHIPFDPPVVWRKILHQFSALAVPTRDCTTLKDARSCGLAATSSDTVCAVTTQIGRQTRPAPLSRFAAVVSAPSR